MITQGVAVTIVLVLKSLSLSMGPQSESICRPQAILSIYQPMKASSRHPLRVSSTVNCIIETKPRCQILPWNIPLFNSKTTPTTILQLRHNQSVILQPTKNYRLKPLLAFMKRTQWSKSTSCSQNLHWSKNAAFIRAGSSSETWAASRMQ